MSTGTTGAIRGGMAYVQAYLDDNPLTQGLAKLQTKLKLWQTSLSKIGAGAYGGELPEPFAALVRFASSPAGAFTALLGAAKYTAEARDKMLEYSEVTGVSVSKLSALGYAAKRANVDMATLAGGLKKMQGKEFQMALQGMGKGGKGPLLNLGGGDAVDQLRQFMTLTKDMDAESRNGLAKKFGISELLPLIAKGVEELDALTARAHKLGLVMSEEDAAAGDRFGDALDDLHDVMMSSVKAIGGALVPMITGLTNILVPVVVGIRDWIKEHKALTIAIFAGTGAIVAGGIALKGMAVITGIASKALSVFQFVVKGLGLAFNVLTSAISFLPLLANPFVLAGLAIGGLVVWIAKLSGAFSGIGKLWKGLSQDFSDAFGAISNALSKGDIQGAWSVVTAFLKTEWIRATNFLAEAWGNFSDYVMQLLDNYAPWMSATVRAMGKAWDWLIDALSSASSWMSKAWATICETMQIVFGGAASWIRGQWDSLMNYIGQKQKEYNEKGLKKAGLPSEDVIRRLAAEKGMDPDEAVRNAKAKGTLGARTDTSDAKSIPDIRKFDADALAKQQAAELAARKKGRELESSDKLAKAQAELKKAVDAANAPGADALGKNDKGKNGFAAAQASEMRGTFSGAAAGMLGGGGVAALLNRQIAVQQQQFMMQEKQWEEQRKLTAAMTVP